MAWYNFFSWFSKDKSSPSSRSNDDQRPSESSSIDLYCDSPQCRGPIVQESGIAHNKAEKEIYHGGECGLMAGAHKAMTTGGITFGNFDYITRAKAEQLARKGKLRQSTSTPLEDSLD